MNKRCAFLMVMVCLLFAACDKDDVLPGEPMEWSYEILTPDNVKYTGGSVESTPRYCFKANSKEGDVVMTCNNYDALDPMSGESFTYDCGWATLKVDGNRVKIHFPPIASEASDAYEEIRISATDGGRKASTIISLTRTFKEGQPDPKPQTLPDEAKFKLKEEKYSPLMGIESPLPAPLDLVTFRITDLDRNYTALGFPKFTEYYDSIVWSADNYPHTYKIYECNVSEGGVERHLTTQWASHFFKSGTVKSHLKGYHDGKVKYEAALDLTLYDRDFLGLKWGDIVLSKPQNLTTYCLLDREYEYQVCDIVAKNDAPYSRIIPVNHKLLPDKEFLAIMPKSIKALVENSVGVGQNAKGKEKLFKCLPETGVEALLYWENKTTRMLLLHQLANEDTDFTPEFYYLHLEPK